VVFVELFLLFTGLDVNNEFYPYYPSLIKWNKSNATFTPPEVCNGCHSDKYDEWTGSVHALAFRTPIYQGEIDQGVKAVDMRSPASVKGAILQPEWLPVR